jgi:hypothetical protein
MRTFAKLLFLIAIAASQPHYWLLQLAAFIARILGD